MRYVYMYSLDELKSIYSYKISIDAYEQIHCADNSCVINKLMFKSMGTIIWIEEDDRHSSMMLNKTWIIKDWMYKELNTVFDKI